MFKRIVFSHGLCSVRVQWYCKIGNENEDSSARVKIKVFSEQHGRWSDVSDCTKFKSTLQGFVDG